MRVVYGQVQLYTFLLYCNGYAREFGLKKEILDCGAGGRTPSLGIFAEHGYVTHGIDNAELQIQLA